MTHDKKQPFFFYWIPYCLNGKPSCDHKVNLLGEWQCPWCIAKLTNPGATHVREKIFLIVKVS